jgi:V/A-type H+-transporting ATPase subunit D
MTDRELVPTQSAFLELKAERAGMQEGYRFLDEKRLILAGEIMANLRAYDATWAHWQKAEATARQAVRAAVGRHGLDELSLYPPEVADCGLETKSRSVLGVRIEEPAPVGHSAGGAQASADLGDDRFAAPGADDDDLRTQETAVSSRDVPANRSPEAQACRTAFGALLPLAARLAVLSGNLERLRVEYLRTSRRARALEDVLLPETDARLAAIEAALEELEREEAVRVRQRSPAA